MLKLPARIRLTDAPGIWVQLEGALKAEAVQVGNAAGSLLQLNAGELSEFDSSALTLLLSAARLCGAQGLQLQVREAPLKLRELARVYGVDELLWPAPASASV